MHYENPVVIDRFVFKEKIPESSSVWEALGNLDIFLNKSCPELVLQRDGLKKSIIMAIPSLSEQISNSSDEIDVHAPITSKQAGCILEQLKFWGYHMPPNPERPDPGGYRIDPKENHPEVLSITYGGASMGAAITLAGSIATNWDYQSVIVGAEKLSKMRTRDLVESAGRSICPNNLYGNTLSNNVPFTLISAYALLESSYKGVSDALDSIRSKEGACMSGRIHTGEIAGANDGVVGMVVRPMNTEDREKTFLVSGALTPEEPINWLTVPSKVNFARTTLNNLPLPNGFDRSKLDANFHIEPYDCFMIAKFLQVAAILDLEINSETIPRIVEFCKNWETVSPLKKWASWGISSAKKMQILIDKLKNGQLENVIVIGNGGVADSISSICLTTSLKIASKMREERSQPFIISNPKNWTPLKLQHEPAQLEGAKGIIDMVAFQRPIVKKDEIIQEGSTFARVVLKNHNCVLTNLAIKGRDDSIYEDLIEKACLGTEVLLQNCDGVIRAVID